MHPGKRNDYYSNVQGSKKASLKLKVLPASSAAQARGKSRPGEDVSIKLQALKVVCRWHQGLEAGRGPSVALDLLGD